MNKICEFCGKEFNADRKERRFCSVSCSSRWHYQQGFNLGFQKGHGNFDGSEKGWFTTDKAGGENNVNWKGDEVGYGAIHQWLKRNKDGYGMCDNCGKIGPTDAANISGEYLRHVDDYVWLCKSCHKKLDFDFDLIKRDELGRFTSESFRK